MNNLLQQDGIPETRNHWKTLTQMTSHSQRQLASLRRHWSKWKGQSSDGEHEQGMFCNFLEKSRPIFLWLRVTKWNPKQSTNQAWWRMGPVVTGNEWRGQGTPRQRALGPSETTYRQGRHTGKMGLQNEIGPSGQVDKYKARYVAKVSNKWKDWTTLKFLRLPVSQRHSGFYFSYQRSKVMHQFDVKTAFLRSPIEEEVYLEQPQEFVKRRSDGEKLVCRLNKSIYGLKQAAYNWYKELANFLLQQDGIPETRNPWKTLTQMTSHSQRQLSSLRRRWSKWKGQSSDGEHEQGMFCNFLEKSRPIFLWLRVTKWNPKQSTNQA